MSKTHGWDIESMRNYGKNLPPKAADIVMLNPEPQSKSTAELQAEYDQKVAEIDKIWENDCKGHMIERSNLAAEYSQYTDGIGEYLIEGVDEYMDDEWDDYQAYG